MIRNIATYSSDLIACAIILRYACINMQVAVDRAELFQLRGSTFSLMVLKVIDPSNERFFDQLHERVRQAPQLFLGAPVVLDLSASPSGGPLDALKFAANVRAVGLVPIGVQGVSAEIAEKLSLPIITGGRAAREAEPPKVSPPEPPPPPAPPQVEAEPPSQAKTPKRPMMITEPVRSGRRVYSQGDLIVTASVSPGAELVAEGHIHIYGALRGRAIAGNSGDRTARIFCQSLQAELVSIAGLYRLMDEIDQKTHKKSVKIHLEADRLCIETLG